MENKEKISVGDNVVFPLGSIKDEERYNTYEGVVIRITGFGIFKKYYVLYRINGFEKIDSFDYKQIHKRQRIKQLIKENFMDNREIDEYKVRTDLIFYCYTFQQFNMDKKREIEEIEGIIDAIPHNCGCVRNDIIFEGTFDYLVKNIRFLKDRVASLKNSRDNEKFNLREFIIYSFSVE